VTLIDLFQTLNKLDLTSPLTSKKGHFVVDDVIGTGLLFASVYHDHPDDYVIVANNLYSAQKTYEFLLNFFKEDQVVFFPADELLRAEALSSSRELMAQRIYALGQLVDGNPKILVTHPAALLRYLPDPAEFKKSIRILEKGKKVNLGDLKNDLVMMGYHRVNKIDQSLEFASRGDILDVFSVNYLSPIRIEFFDDEIESIKTFDVATQSSLKDIDRIKILPATDTFMTDDETTSFAERIKKRLEFDSKILPPSFQEVLMENAGRDIEDIVARNYKPTLYKYYGFALNNAFSVCSYFQPRLLFIPDKDSFVTASDMLVNEAHEYFSELVNEGLIPTHLQEYMEISEALPDYRRVFYGHKFFSDPNDFVFTVRHIVSSGTGIASLVSTVQSYLRNDKKVVLALCDPHQIETAKSFLDDSKIPYEKVNGFNLPNGPLGLSSLNLNEGFEIPDLGIVYLSDSEIFGQRMANTRFSSRFKDATILKSYEDLRPGDYVVHEYNGVGQFVEVKTLEVEGIHRDYLRIAYAGNETLYVPLEQFRLVRKYAGREGAAPKLSHLSGGEWQKKKEHIKERVNELADRLIALYGARAKTSGFSFPPDDEFQKEFEDEFPYELTPDQTRSLKEIKADMEKPEIMDRLLCGDVGFGKTEIAFRAAFKAILAGKQVAILCPTTLLARQHYEVALQRFSDFGIRICLFSRLVPLAQQKISIEAVKDGKVDLVIGTHRLLSKEISFKDLGLLIVDEEQRFGVEQKEQIKEIKKNVDVLTLSATPIPRTLQMSLVGIRPLSQINTAPDSRMPIQTYVAPYKEDVAFELIQRELARNGQVFYVFNKVASIYMKANQIARAIPSAKIGVVHGKMEKEEIEDVMSKFYDNEINILVCTSIIENGIDIPNANMIVVEDADKFGLSQLYQIKGRVGRGDRIAYAYLMYKPQKDMNEDAQKRLQAIQEFTELGSGYKIAQRDLMIRGAGDILGAEQAGFIDTIGLDLYMKLLNEAIQEKKTGIKAEQPKANHLFDIDAYIPKTYAINSDKVELYQELENAKSETEVDGLAKHMRDVYGELPAEVLLLLAKKKIDLLGSNEEFASISEGETHIDILMSDSFSRVNGIGVDLFNVVVPFLSIITVNFLEKKLHIRMTKGNGWLANLDQLLRTIHSLYLRHKEGVSVIN
jgi:transcription-repair coupling factor (superfamily II helicase)